MIGQEGVFWYMLLNPRNLLKQIEDPGLGEKYQERNASRLINKDGSFNVRKSGNGWSTRNTYQHLINMSWGWFFCLIISTYLFINLLFALGYVAIGMESLNGIPATVHFWQDLSHAFYFSCQTFTTVGYGAISPITQAASWLSSIESMSGLLYFALATGLLWGRFSRPQSRLMYSENMVVAPYREEDWAFMFRVANERSNVLMEMEATLMLTWVEQTDTGLKRQYFNLDLERNSIYFFPLNWTIVHPIDESSPLHGKSREDLNRLQTEFLILIKGFDDTFSQTVHSRFSYICDEIVWGARFVPAFKPNDRGQMELDFQKLHEYEKLAYP